MRLVVIGNGMAGARTVEDILDRSADASTITVFGDEPYGNYNRIPLSNVLNGTARIRAEIFLNPLAWYAENGITLHAGDARHPRRPLRARPSSRPTATRHPYDYLVFATGSRVVRPADRVPGATTARCARACSSSARCDDCRHIIACAQTRERAS